MPKLKTKSAVKKRFKISAEGKLISAHAGKRHFMRRRSRTKIRDLRGTRVVKACDAKHVLKFYIHYGIG